MGDVGMETAVSSEDPMTAEVYEIKVKGHLVQEWSEWLGDLRINYDDEGNTLLSGRIPDQAALHGILGQIRDLGITQISLSAQKAE